MAPLPGAGEPVQAAGGADVDSGADVDADDDAHYRLPTGANGGLGDSGDDGGDDGDDGSDDSGGSGDSGDGSGGDDGGGGGGDYATAAGGRLSREASSEADAPPGTAQQRRSSRVACMTRELRELGRERLRRAEVERAAARRAEKERRDAQLEQVVPAKPGEGAVSPPAYAVRMHPCAAALMHIHAHFAHTEVIGYLGGVVCDVPVGAGGGGGPAQQTMFVIEAFPVRNLTARELAKEGRSAANEVEMEPESACEVQMRIAGKGMAIVGWYHSHPYFSACPSELDVENQRNQQTLLFQDAPYVAAICAPFWDELPDCRAKLDLFYVDRDLACPVEVAYETSFDRPPVGAAGSKDFYAALSDATGQPVADGEDLDGEVRRHVDLQRHASLENEAVNLVSHYSHFPKRVNLHGEWRVEVTVLDKLRLGLELSLFGGDDLPAQPQVAADVDEVVDDAATAGGGGGAASAGGETKPGAGAGAGASSELSAESTAASRRAEGRADGGGEGGRTEGAAGRGAAAAGGASRVRQLNADERALVSLLENLLSLAGDTWASADAERRGRAAGPGAAKKGKKRRLKPR
jgi:proteasome lid subunit RPN8/RPN11